MANYSADISASASDIMDIPDDLQGLVREVNGLTEVGPTKTGKETKGKKNLGSKPNDSDARKEDTIPVVNGDALWESFVNGCDYEEAISKVVGRNGNAGWCPVDKKILSAFRRCRVNGHSIKDMVNSVLRQFIIHYHGQLSLYKQEGEELL